MGDAWKVEQVAINRIKDVGVHYASPSEYLAVLDEQVTQIELEEKARKAAERTQAKIRSVSDDVSRTIFVGEDPHKKFMSPALMAIYNRRK
jgi:hypothetical protein